MVIIDSQVFLVPRVNGRKAVRDGRKVNFIDEYLSTAPIPEIVDLLHEQRRFRTNQECQSRNL